MSHIVLYIAMSLDGYIADETGGVDWLKGDGSDPNHLGTYASFLNSVDTIVMGRKTYDQVIHELSPNEWPYVGKECHVLSTRPLDDSATARIASNVDDLLTQWRKEPNRRVWICGGAAVVKTFLQKRAIDQLRIAIIPILLGNGIRLFENGLPRQTWKLADTVSYNGIVELTYDRIENDESSF